MKDEYNTVVVGGGFYGLCIALFLHEELHIKSILVIEKETTMMSRASYVNQARVHNGYHYPRSVLTGYRSAVNFPNFVKEYNDAIVSDFDKYYAISRVLSKVNAQQFKKFCEKIGAEFSDAPQTISTLFNSRLTEKVYKVKEYAFDSHKLRDALLARIDAIEGITIHNGEEVDRIKQGQGKTLLTITDKNTYRSEYVLNCVYSQINNLHRRSQLSLVPIKHEITEMCLVQLPEKLKDFSITVMDGPFFSIMPFPSRKLHTLSHVRYTPHLSWIDDENTPPDRYDTHRYFSSLHLESNYKKMYSDVIRYIPSLKDMKYIDSISEVKTVLLKSESDDSRPILFKPHFGLHNYTCIMGGKLDNIYDVFQELRELYGEG